VHYNCYKGRRFPFKLASRKQSTYSTARGMFYGNSWSDDNREILTLSLINHHRNYIQLKARLSDKFSFASTEVTTIICNDEFPPLRVIARTERIKRATSATARELVGRVHAFRVSFRFRDSTTISLPFTDNRHSRLLE
jgi:hypothetical protein